jgi:hypothetical protein
MPNMGERDHINSEVTNKNKNEEKYYITKIYITREHKD